MPRAITLGQYKTRALRLSGLTGTQFDGPGELTDLANTHRCEVLALLSKAGPPNYKAKSFQIVTTSGTSVYPFYTYATDFGWLSGVYSLTSVDSSGYATRVPIRPINDKERGAFSVPGGACTVEIEYTPLPVDLVADTDVDDGLFGYEELVISLMARDMCIKQRQDFAGIQTKIDEMRNRIISEATNRDKGNPRFMQGCSENGYRRSYIPGSANIGGYRLRGDTIELYQPSALWW